MPPSNPNSYPNDPTTPDANTNPPPHDIQTPNGVESTQAVKSNSAGFGKGLSLFWSSNKLVLSLLLALIILIIIIIGSILIFSSNGKNASKVGTDSSTDVYDSSTSDTSRKYYTLSEINKSLVGRDFILYDGEKISDDSYSTLELNMKFPIPGDSGKIDFTGKKSKSGIYPRDSVYIDSSSDAQFYFENIGTDHKNFGSSWRNSSFGMNGGPAYNESIENNLTKYNAGMSSTAGIRGIDTSTATLEKISNEVFVYTAETKDSLEHVGMVKDIIIECPEDFETYTEYNRMSLDTGITLYKGKIDSYVNDYNKLISTIAKSININKCGLH